jgi:hypothetical protein
MSHNRLINTNLNFHQSLFDLDSEQAITVKSEGCRYCKGKSHQANYPRIGFGLSPKVAPLYDTRFSFCCADCRRRTTPGSVRFMGRRRYAAAVFLLLCASNQFLPTERYCERLAKRFGLYLSVRT